MKKDKAIQKSPLRDHHFTFNTQEGRLAKITITTLPELSREAVRRDLEASLRPGADLMRASFVEFPDASRRINAERFISLYMIFGLIIWGLCLISWVNGKIHKWDEALVPSWIPLLGGINLYLAITSAYFGILVIYGLKHLYQLTGNRPRNSVN
ncbi:hypothetical protein ACI2KR_27360 [Pseudomonas luteola]